MLPTDTRSSALRLLRALFEDAIGNLRLRFSRSVLAVLGIGIGAAAVTAMLQVGHNARAEAMREFDDVGADFAMILPPQMPSAPQLRREDVGALATSAIGIARAAPIIVATGTVVEGADRIQATVIGTTADLASVLRLLPNRGRFVSNLDEHMPFAVIGADVARRIQAARRRPLAVGDAVRLDGTLLQVVGQLPAQEVNPIVGLDLNQAVIVPFGATVRYSASPAISYVVARMEPRTREADVVAATIEFFRQRLRGASVEVRVASMLIATIDREMSIYGNLLLAIGAVSLTMGGIGIMNVMLMSVMERREEIGLRAAVGATPRAILTMVLIESVCLAILGAAGGTGLGILAGWFFVWRSGWSFEIAPLSVPLGAGMALVAGLLFGLYPAWRAAALQPVEALRRG